MSIENSFSEPQRLLPRTLEDVLRGWAWRGFGALVVLTASAFWISLLTWSANDPGVYPASSGDSHNLLGPIGAQIADFTLHALGLAAVFVLIPPIICGLQIMLGEHLRARRLRAGLYLVSTIAIAAGWSALPVAERWPIALGYGGFIGDFVFMLAAGLLAEFHAASASTITGLVCFATGFWAFSRVIELDRCSVFDFSRPLGLGRLAPRMKKRVPESIRPASKAAATPMMPSVEPKMEPLPEPAAPSWSLRDRLHDVANKLEPAIIEPVAYPAIPEVSISGDDDGSSAIARRFAPTGHAQTTLSDGPCETVDPVRPTRDLSDLPRIFREQRNASPVAPPRDLPPAAPRPPEPAAQPSHGHATGYRRPSLNLLAQPAPQRPSADHSPSVLQGNSRLLEDVLADFRIKGEIKAVRPGPVVTVFELEPAPGTKSSRVIALADDVARSMSAISARIAVVPGKNIIGIELPNARRMTFGLREIVDSPAFRDTAAKLPIVLGKDIGGDPVIADLARMPHLLVAGTTGSGKSVGINAMILSLIYRFGPEACRFLMIDPKMLELSVYNGIPHLLTPVITDANKAIAALNWAVSEMEERYKRMAELGVRSIEMFNNRVRHAALNGETLNRIIQTGFDQNSGNPVYTEKAIDLEPLPYIVVVIDEFADLMAVAGREIEGLVQRLAQMARAAGIHIVMATQRPSVDVVTGTIKANFPSRASYRVASRVDSRTILGEQGAEQLLGQGDMLFLGESGQVTRVHGPFVSDGEVEAIMRALQSTATPRYVDGITDFSADQPPCTEQPELYVRATQLVREEHKASASFLQRRLAIGYNRAADLIDRMEADGIIGPAGPGGRREILS